MENVNKKCDNMRAADEELRPACLEAEQWTVSNTTGWVCPQDI